MERAACWLKGNISILQLINLCGLKDGNSAEIAGQAIRGSGRCSEKSPKNKIRKGGAMRLTKKVGRWFTKPLPVSKSILIMLGGLMGWIGSPLYSFSDLGLSGSIAIIVGAGLLIYKGLIGILGGEQDCKTF
jgi:hypothetical protein